MISFYCVYTDFLIRNLLLGHILTSEFLSSLLVATAFTYTAFIVAHTTRPTNSQTGLVAYQGSLHVTSDDFNHTLLDQDSQNYREKEVKYGHLVS